MQLDILGIMERIPHRYPFLLVDRITDLNLETETIVGLKNVSMNEAQFAGHFPGHPILPGVLILEGLAQCLGVLVFEKYRDGSNTKVPYFAAVEGAKFRAPVTPGDQMIYEAKIEKERRNIIKGSGIVKVDGKVVAEAKFTFSIMEK